MLISLSCIQRMEFLKLSNMIWLCLSAILVLLIY
uniref:Uncharacterized protein n=1 Tax=Anguilla anguilla TaxID=7936 RepID=A0A0E9UM86_ANGAN